MTIDTALAEIDAKEGDIVQVSTYRPTSRPIRVGAIGEKLRASKGFIGFLPEEASQKLAALGNKMDQMGRKTSLSYLYPDYFFDSLLRDNTAKNKNYIYTRILSRLLFEKNPSIDSIVYHSVASFGSHNIAFPSKKADELLGLENTILIKIKKKYDYGLYDIELLKEPKEILNNGDIVW
mgnify:CR=1 FL=1